MFNKYINIEDAGRSAAINNLAHEVKEQTKAHEDNLTRDIMARNRVDISLDDYLEMKETIAKLEHSVDYYEGILKAINFPLLCEAAIDVGSMRVENFYNEYYRTHQCNISFDYRPKK